MRVGVPLPLSANAGLPAIWLPTWQAARETPVPV